MISFNDDNRVFESDGDDSIIEIDITVKVLTLSYPTLMIH